MQDLETKRSKYKGQLMEVKTNKEYTAMLHEIEAVEREIRAREDQILAEMEQAEALAAEVKREEAALQGGRGAAKAREREALDEPRARPSRQEPARLTAERDAVAATRRRRRCCELFQRVAKAARRRGGRGPGRRCASSAT